MTINWKTTATNLETRLRAADPQGFGRTKFEGATQAEVDAATAARAAFIAALPGIVAAADAAAILGASLLGYVPPGGVWTPFTIDPLTPLVFAANIVGRIAQVLSQPGATMNAFIIEHLMPSTTTFSYRGHDGQQIVTPIPLDRAVWSGPPVIPPLGHIAPATSDAEVAAGEDVLSTLQVAGAAYDACFTSASRFSGATPSEVAAATERRATFDARATRVLRWVNAAVLETANELGYVATPAWTTTLDPGVLSNRYELLCALAPTAPFLLAVLQPAGAALPAATNPPHVPALGELITQTVPIPDVPQATVDAAVAALTNAMTAATDFLAMLVLQDSP